VGFFVGYEDPRPLAHCDLCGAPYPVSKPWQRFCSRRCNWNWQRRHGKKGRTVRLKRKLRPEPGTLLGGDLGVVLIDGQPRVRAAVWLEQRRS